MSACNWVTPPSGRWKRGTSPAPASGPVPVTTVPAAIMRPSTATAPNANSRTSRGTSSRVGPRPSVQRTYSATAAATRAMESRKCTLTQTGSSLVSTTIPPRAAWARIPAGCAEASQTRSLRRPLPSGRYRQAAMNTATATTKIATVTSRLPNSIQRWMSGSPVAPLATMLVAVHLGQSGQPSPDSLSRTPAPVMMMAADATTPASASRRIEVGDGASTASAQRRGRPGTEPIVRVNLFIRRLPPRLRGSRGTDRTAQCAAPRSARPAGRR